MQRWAPIAKAKPLYPPIVSNVQTSGPKKMDCNQMAAFSGNMNSDFHYANLVTLVAV